ADLALGETKVPVKMYSAVQDAKVHFRLLHAADHAPVKQQMVDPATEQPVVATQTKKAVAVDRGVYVLLTEEEQVALAPKPSRLISIEQVVPADAIDERWFDRPYYLGPDGDEEGYFALAEALDKRGAVGVAHWVLRNRSYVGALQASGGYLLLDTLRYAEQIVEVGAVQPSANRAPDKREIALAEQLIGALEDRFDATEFRDEYQEQVRNMIAAKAAGKVVRFPKAPKREPTDSLVASLQASLKASRKDVGAGHGRRA
ncbi:MAG TPA: Ku protein, partial [Gammaproteobacteria bacterium]|nr:Ku protein [Gammaproteobacteria bacterium]